MKHALMVVALLVACGKSGEEQAKEDNAKEQAKVEASKPKDEPAPPPKTMGSAEAAKPVETKPPEPEPTTPAEIDHARNQAMIDGRDKDVLKYCEMGKLDDKSNPQALLGCTLAACRLKDEATARKYGTPIKGPLKDQAKKVCIQNQIGL
ncbi:MAG: hypothetical protein JO257_08315 [Deltaproteobacteria bacterium]|nr:hypothetical protein [Deltaproteobacteria bacterium]